MECGKCNIKFREAYKKCFKISFKFRFTCNLKGSLLNEKSKFLKGFYQFG